MLTNTEKAQLWDAVKPLETAMLVSMRDSETLQARPMQLVQKEFDGIFYFFSKHPTEKTQEINNQHKVCLTFSCPKAQSYVSVSGNASVEKDMALIEQFWNPFVEAWFPQGKTDPSVQLIKVEVMQAEYWQGEGTKLTQLFKYGKAYITGEQPHIGKHEHLG